MPMNEITATANTLAYYIRRQEVAAGNIARSSTTAFKAERLSAQQAAEDAPPTPLAWRDWTQGTLRATSRPLDLAVDGPGFLVVDTPAGELLTRGGELEIDEARRLTTSGHPVLGESGPIQVDGASIVIERDGSVVVDGTSIGRLRLATVPDPAALEIVDGNLFAPPEPAAPAVPGTVTVRQGYLEGSNLDPLLSMVDMISVQRAYAANLQVLRAMDRVLGIAAAGVGGE